MEFDQSSPYAPSEKREVIADTGRDTSLPREGAGGREQKETPQTPFVSCLLLHLTLLMSFCLCLPPETLEVDWTHPLKANDLYVSHIKP